MPVWIDDGRHRGRPLGRPPALLAPDGDCLEIGLVNNMPGAASKAAERQFVALLDAAAADMPVRLRLYTLHTAAERDAAHAGAAYHGIDELWDRRHDGVIVTGKEPCARNLTEESYWPILTGILEWADDNAVSTVWSCLAAHAAVLHLDGIDRRQLDDKRSGIFEFAKVSDHMLMQGVAPRVRIPHSRWNDLPGVALASCGYRILTRADRAGVDAFVKQSSGLLVFFQGHPEYEPDTLLREYRRDIGRFLRRERDSYPAMPRYYFDEATVAKLLAFREWALIDRREEMLAAFPSAAPAANCAQAWRGPAVRIYRNWLMHMAAQKSRRRKPSCAISSRRTVAH
jgi:homoserine O-succinyltransferase